MASFMYLTGVFFIVMQRAFRPLAQGLDRTTPALGETLLAPEEQNVYSCKHKNPTPAPKERNEISKHVALLQSSEN